MCKTVRFGQVLAKTGLAGIWLTMAMSSCLTIVNADVYSITPLAFDNYRVTGVITTDGTTGTLQSQNILAWHITVSQFNDYHFTSSNTQPVVSLTSATSTHIRVATSPNGVDDGGTLGFAKPWPVEYGVRLADFSGAYVAGGVAAYVAGSAFDFAYLDQPDGIQHIVANAVGGGVYTVAPVVFPGGATMTGTIVTDGTTGSLSAANLLDWDILVREQTDDVFTNANSTLSPATALVSADSNSLRIANPGGYLEFLKASIGGHRHSIQLADFLDGNNQAGYFYGSFFSEVWSPLSSQSSYLVASAIPEPSVGLMLPLAVSGFLRRRARSPRGDFGRRNRTIG